MSPDPLANVAVVLDHPQDLVNIAGVVRVMMNFGLRDLRLVAPGEFDTWRIGGIAHRSDPVLERTSIHATLDEAVANASFVVGTTARPRTAGRTYLRPREAASLMLERAVQGQVALLFGREDRGLTNEALDRCHAVVIIPTDPVFPSLNLAQASLVLAYELFLAAPVAADPLPRGRRATRPPTQGEMEQAFAALRDGLARIEFYKARKPSAVMRTLRTLVTRAAPDLRETRLLAAIGFEIGHYVDRLLERGREGGHGPDGPAAPRPKR